MMIAVKTAGVSGGNAVEARLLAGGISVSKNSLATMARTARRSGSEEVPRAHGTTGQVK
jgi:hypothetical protein